MKTARSTYYAWVAGTEAREARRQADEALAHEITVIHIASWPELRRPARHRRTTPAGAAGQPQAGGPGDARARHRGEQPAHGPPQPDQGRHQGRPLTRPDRPGLHRRPPGTKIVGDITYIPTAEGWLYLASWLDLATREVIGYSMADHHRAELVVDALDMADALGRLEPGCVIHSDRGPEYTSGQFRARIRELGHRQSMGRTGSCFDNAAAESFWAVLKEEIGTRFWPDRASARAAIFDFIETFYNRRRLRKHIHWGYLTPHETRLRFRQDQALAANETVSKITGKTSHPRWRRYLHRSFWRRCLVGRDSRDEPGLGRRRRVLRSGPCVLFWRHERSRDSR
ncbi:IS3 family transposase [Streptomyces lavendulae]|uniref:IS3 family transposase n=1 Tax=Streptomyces lavendulae TaxID=1914 RepID=UPI003F4CF950